MSDSPIEKRPIVLSIHSAGTPEFPRFIISDQFLRYWTGEEWSKQSDQSSALIYSDSNDAIDEMHKLMTMQYEKLPVHRYRAPLYIDLYSDSEVSVRDLRHWLVKTTKLLVDSPRYGNGPVSGSLGICRIEFGEMENLK
jgi:hypothetical protein